MSKVTLDRYSMMIVSKYFKTIGDFIKMIRISKKFEEIPAMFHYNPVKLMMKTKFFPNIETYHIFTKNDKVIKGYNKYVYWNEVNYDTYLKKKENEEYRKVKFNEYDWEKYKSFKGATIFRKYAMRKYEYETIDLSGVIQLNDFCFDSCTSLQHVTLSKNISLIPANCFNNCVSLREIDLSYVKFVKEGAFYQCSSLTSITLPDKLLEIGENSFYGLINLQRVDNKGIKIIDCKLDYSTAKLFEHFGIQTKKAYHYNENDVVNHGIEIPENVISLDSGFNQVTTVGDFILPTTVTYIGYNCFNDCSLKSIDLTHVKECHCQFNRCTQLTSITLNSTLCEKCPAYDLFNHSTILENIELIGTDFIKEVSYHLSLLMKQKGYKFENIIYTKADAEKLNYEIPDGVNVITDYVVFENDEIETITIPSSVTLIASGNFYSLGSLTSIDIKCKNCVCHYGCFDSIPLLKELDLSGFSDLYRCCFYNLEALTKVTLPLAQISESCFDNCPMLSEIELAVDNVQTYDFPIKYETGKLLEKKGIQCPHKVLIRDGQKIYKEIPNDVQELAGYVFEDFDDETPLTEIIIPSSVTKIRRCAFYYCQQLTKVVFEGNPEIEENAFLHCAALAEANPELKKYCEFKKQ